MNRYPMQVAWSEEDGCWVAKAVDLPGCWAHGATPEDAVRELGEAMRAWLETARERGIAVPEPSSISRVA